MAQHSVKVICVQFEPQYKQISKNIAFVSKLLSKYTKEDKIDIIIFPETALTGYIFDNKEDILPYTSPYDSGETFEFCSSLSKRLNCYVFMGYPEKTENNTLYNSAMITNPKGESLPSYRKSFLYDDDKRWSSEGNGFGYMEITTHSGKEIKLGIGICMDINPYEFKSPWEKMEFGTHCKEKDVDIIVFLTNWTDYEKYEDKSKKAIYESINYWLCRLEPIYKQKKNVYLCCADRTGLEKGTHFLGCSCIVKLTPRAELVNYLDKTTQGIICEELKLE